MLSNENWFYPTDKHPTVCVTCVWAGVDSVWEQENAEARKKLENAAESPASGAPRMSGGSVNDN
jgi:hypothetical protein